MQGFGRRGRADTEAEAFDGWLVDAIADPARRENALLAWLDAAYARECHPEAEHLIPLHIVAGAAGKDIGRQVYRDTIGGKAISAFQFG